MGDSSCNYQFTTGQEPWKPRCLYMFVHVCTSCMYTVYTVSYIQVFSALLLLRAYVARKECHKEFYSTFVESVCWAEMQATTWFGQGGKDRWYCCNHWSFGRSQGQFPDAVLGTDRAGEFVLLGLQDADQRSRDKTPPAVSKSASLLKYV